MRSQVTLFVILGILLLAVTAFIVIKLSNNTPPEVILPDEDQVKIQPFIDYADECVKKTTEDALILLGDQGLLYPDVYLASKNTKIAYFYFKGKEYFPKIEDIEKDISKYVNENVAACINLYLRAGHVLNPKASSPKTSTFIEDNNVKVTVIYPVELYAEGLKVELKEFESDVDLNFLEIWDISRELFLNIIVDPEWIDLEFIKIQPVDISIIKIDKSTLVYELEDKQGLENKPYKFRFAVKYGV